MTFKKNLLIGITSALYAGIAGAYIHLGLIAWENHQKRWPGESQPTTVMGEVCYNKNTGEEVRLTPLDYQQIQSRARRGFDGLWPNLECKLAEK